MFSWYLGNIKGRRIKYRKIYHFLITSFTRVWELKKEISTKKWKTLPQESMGTLRTVLGERFRLESKLVIDNRFPSWNLKKMMTLSWKPLRKLRDKLALLKVMLNVWEIKVKVDRLWIRSILLKIFRWLSQMNLRYCLVNKGRPLLLLQYLSLSEWSLIQNSCSQCPKKRMRSPLFKEKGLQISYNRKKL